MARGRRCLLAGPSLQRGERSDGMSDPFVCAGEVRLKRGRDASVLRRHPWVYRGALAAPPPGGHAPVRVVAANGRPLGVALPGGSGGSLALRMVAFGEERWDADAFAA